MHIYGHHLKEHAAEAPVPSDHLDVAVVTRGNTFSHGVFSHTNRSFRVLGHQCVLTFASH